VSSTARLPLSTRFRLGEVITTEQRAFLDQHGFLLFERVASADEVSRLLAELERIERQFVAERRDAVYGIPLFWGTVEGGSPLLQRFPFTSCFSDVFHEFVRDPRFLPIRQLIGENTRVGDREKDGVVVNRYVNTPGSVLPLLGWHTDGLRDLFYLRMPKQMLNVGLHFDRVTAADGGLRLLPGTHTQGFFSMCFRKRYFVDHTPDPDEIAIETEPGDLTVHDGRLWHRVQLSPYTGARSLRRTMYVPYLTDAYQPKGDHSPTPLYHRVGQLVRRLRRPHY
jgi:ectoine hydroxylase-related dioxygenase (phytanoyl-CoA dioxygenase family)